MSLVSWQESAREKLADIWVQATPEERTAIEGIILGTERMLADDPHGVANPAPADLVLFIGPQSRSGSACRRMEARCESFGFVGRVRLARANTI
jgi:hypothetical protein